MMCSDESLVDNFSNVVPVTSADGVIYKVFICCMACFIFCVKHICLCIYIICTDTIAGIKRNVKYAENENIQRQIVF